jgi:hypothetical protein
MNLQGLSSTTGRIFIEGDVAVAIADIHAECCIYVHATVDRIWAADCAISSEAPNIAVIRLYTIKLIDTPVINF